jgi:hypothetical protein
VIDRSRWLYRPMINRNSAALRRSQGLNFAQPA